MGKTLQNVLASNSDGTIAYICGKCHSEVAKDAKICPNCKAKLGNIRCPFCNFKGSLDDFKNDTCPRCGRKKNIEINKKNSPVKNENIYKDKIPEKNGFLKKYFTLLFGGLLIFLFFLFWLFLYYFEII